MRRLNINDVRSRGLEKGLLLLSETYKNSKTKLIWTDEEGYLYYSSFDKVRSGKPYRFSIDNIFIYDNFDNFFKHNNLKYHYVSGEYINFKSKLTWIDDDGYLYFCPFQDFLSGNGARIVSQSNPYSILNIKLYIELNKRTDILLSDEYISNGTKNKEDKLCFQCENGHIFYCTWADYRHGNGCRKCVKRFVNHEEYLECIKEMYGNEYTLITKYTKSTEYIKVKHNICGTVFDTIAEALSQGHGCPRNECCKKRGENHYRWKSELTEEDRLKNMSRTTDPQYINWRKNVLSRDEYRCAICNCKSTRKNPLRVHHLNSWSDHIDDRYSEDNGITLCEEHHKEFHSLYGYGNNTKEQFYEYYNNHENTEVNNQIA